MTTAPAPSLAPAVTVCPRHGLPRTVGTDAGSACFVCVQGAVPRSRYVAPETAAVLARAERLGWPQLLYRSPILNERFVIPAGRAAWQAWAGDAIPGDVAAAGVVVGLLEGDRKKRTEERTNHAHD